MAASVTKPVVAFVLATEPVVETFVPSNVSADPEVRTLEPLR